MSRIIIKDYFTEVRLAYYDKLFALCPVNVINSVLADIVQEGPDLVMAMSTEMWSFIWGKE